MLAEGKYIQHQILQRGAVRRPIKCLEGRFKKIGGIVEGGRARRFILRGGRNFRLGVEKP